jgi:hypothetical protein
VPEDNEIEPIETTEVDDARSVVPSIDVHGARFETMVEAAAWGEASAEDLSILDAHKAAWQRVLVERLNDTDEALDRLRARRQPDDQQVIADLDNEQRKLELALDRLLGIEPEPGELAVGVNALQLSWANGRLVAWLGGPEAPATNVEQLRTVLAATDAPEMWGGRSPVTLPSGEKTVALEANTSDVLGWLLALSSDPPED